MALLILTKTGLLPFSRIFLGIFRARKSSKLHRQFQLILAEPSSNGT